MFDWARNKPLLLDRSSKWPFFTEEKPANYFFRTKHIFFDIVAAIILIRACFLHKKWSFPLKIFSVNVTKSAVSCGFCHIYWRNPSWKISFFVQWHSIFTVAFFTFSTITFTYHYFIYILIFFCIFLIFLIIIGV